MHHAEYVSEKGEDEELVEEEAGIVALEAGFRWKVTEGQWDDSIKVGRNHPVFMVPVERVMECREWFGTRPGF